MFFLLLLIPFSAFSKTHTYANVLAHYVSNYDGDTVKVNIPSYPPIVGKKINIRVNGIDTPEIKGNCKKEKILARQGKRLVSSMLKGSKSIELKNLKRGKYFRIVADIYVNGQSISKALLKNNLAVAYDGGKKTKNWCAS